MWPMWSWSGKRLTDDQFFFLTKLFTIDVNMEYILEQQYQLARYANISIKETEQMADIDRFAYYALLLKDEKDKENY